MRHARRCTLKEMFLVTYTDQTGDRFALLIQLEGLAALPLHSLRNHFLETVVLGDEFVEPETCTYFIGFTFER